MLRADLPFRRVAVVLSGGGALGGYEVGVLRLLESTRLVPAILAGTSAGAINAVIWLANGFDSAALRETWRGLRAESVGMRWTTLLVRAGGMALTLYAAIQMALLLLGSPELSVAHRLASGVPAPERFPILPDLLAWLVVALLGVAATALSRPAEAWLAQAHRTEDPGRERRWLLRVLLLLLALEIASRVLAFPWPHRFGVTLVVGGLAAWVLTRPGRAREGARRMLSRVLPETHGRGLWGGAARRRLVESLVGRGDRRRLVSGETMLIVNALALDSGRITHFVSGAPAAEGWGAKLSDLDEVVWLDDPEEVIEAAVASSAIPLAFEPVRLRGREFVDAGQFSNQPLDAAIAAGADALVVVLTAPGSGPLPARAAGNLFDLGGRLLEVATWRQLRIQLEDLPAEWRADPQGAPARVVVVEPESSLPGGLLSFDATAAGDLVARGERDAALALERAGWLEAPPHA